MTDESVEHYKLKLTQDQGFEIIFDTVGGANLDKSFAAAALNGTIVTTAARATLDLTPMHNKGLNLCCVFLLSQLLTNQDREHHGHILEKIAQIVDEGKLKPLMDPHQFTLSDVATAHELLESGKAKGKVVISVN